MFDRLEAFDKAATLWLNNLNTGGGDSFWLLVTGSKIWIPFYIAIVALVIWKLGWKKGLVMIVAVILSDICADQLCNLVKDSACRLRPCADSSMIDAGIRAIQGYNPKHPYGFFSAHAATCFALASGTALSLAWEMKNPQKAANKAILISYTTIIYIWAALIGFSRIMVGKHFLGDVICGAFAGLILAYTLCYLGHLLCRRFL